MTDTLFEYLKWIFVNEATAVDSGMACPDCGAELEELFEGYLVCGECLRDEDYDDESEDSPE